MFYGSQPLAKYSEDLERASFFEDKSDNDNSMPRKTSRSRKGKRVAKTSRGIKFSSRRLLIRVPGYGLQRFAPSDLVKFIPTLKLRQAAKKVLRSKGISRTKRRRKGGKRKQKK